MKRERVFNIVVLPEPEPRTEQPASQPAQLLLGVAERGLHLHVMFVYRDPLSDAGYDDDVSLSLRLPGRETQGALSAYTHELERNASLRAARDKADEAARQNRMLWQAGRSPYLQSLDADRTLANTDAALAELYDAQAGRTASGMPHRDPTDPTDPMLGTTVKEQPCARDTG